ncbi:hypothetical protein K402DRAFT_403702 [Aulographum hederae CBS 113979]|uniref:Uncharacterized protein n=1 Tax=Aulographum hederae CBS 113979 TaxID=1176131 RepID=A0A6G1H1S1_9PEZI|nr:hypothetical protein K402DRAFT_403702 [Aulographum hederae CBS 113979]
MVAIAIPASVILANATRLDGLNHLTAGLAICSYANVSGKCFYFNPIPQTCSEIPTDLILKVSSAKVSSSLSLCQFHDLDDCSSSAGYSGARVTGGTMNGNFRN